MTTGPQIPSGGFYNGLPLEAQRKILRDFQAVAAAVKSSVSLFDAVIDPAATANKSTHTYPCMASLVANETWGATKIFVVAVIGRPGTPVQETGNSTIPGPIALFAGGLTTGGIHKPFGGSETRPRIDLKGFNWNVTAWVNCTNLEIGNTGGVNTWVQGSSVYLDNCVIDGLNAGAVSLSGVAAGSYIVARSSSFIGVFPQASLINILDDCTIDPGITTGVSYQPVGDLFWSGYYIVRSNSDAISIGPTNNCRIVVTENVNVTNGLSGNTPTINLNGTGYMYLSWQTASNHPILFVGAGNGGGQVYVEGVYQKVSSTNPTGGLQVQKYDIVITGDGTIGNTMLDITGPAEVTAQCKNDIGGNYKTTFRSTGIRADLTIHGQGSAPWINLIGCLDSLITCALSASPVGAQAYAIDAASANCLLLLSGTGGALGHFTVPSTNLGSHCRVITELDDSLVTNLINSGALRGAPGADGEDGLDGFPGPPGTAGATGPQGAAGTGSPGAAGADGQDGDDGFPGPQGAVGPIGPAGARGADGPPGPDGEDGFDGFPGPPGAPGAAGAQGAAGVGSPGTAGVDGQDGDDGLPGPQGAVGQTGARGLQGNPVDGIDGDDGLDGLPGPQGAVGQTGARGAQGTPVDGVDGDDGMDGFPGPQGAPGTPGATGARGFAVDGTDGDDGLDGLPGPQGTPGPTGAVGVTGRAGVDGIDGEDGLDGFPGPAGPMGGSLKQIVWAVGATPVPAAVLVINDTQVHAGDPVIAAVCRISYAQSSGTHMEDELEMEQPQVSAFANGTGIVTLTMTHNPSTGGLLYGNYLIAYTKSAALEALDTNFAQLFMLMGG